MEGNPLSTWKPSPGDSNHPESPDTDTDMNIDIEGNSKTEGLLTRAFAALSRGVKGSTSSSNSASRGNRFVPQFMRRQVNGRQVTTPLGSVRPSTAFGESRYWSNIGPLTEHHKIAGNSLTVPKIAPPTAPTEHKKTILDQTIKKLENISAEWPSKTDFLSQQFAGVCANANNEAELWLSSLEDFSSEMYEFSSPVGLTTTMEQTPIAGRYNAGLKYLQMDLQVQPSLLATESRPMPGLPGPRTIQVVLKLPVDPNDRNREVIRKEQER